MNNSNNYKVSSKFNEVFIKDIFWDSQLESSIGITFMYEKVLMFLPFIFGLTVIFSKNPIHSILFLILTFINIIILMFFLKLEFIPIIFLIVYVGAISVLFLFIVMMLNIRHIENSDSIFTLLPVGIIIGVVIFFELCLLLYIFINFTEVNFSSITSLFNSLYYNIDYLKMKESSIDINILGKILYQNEFIAFILASMILLISMIGSIILTLVISRDTYNVKRQKIFKQVYRKIRFKIYNNKH